MKTSSASDAHYGAAGIARRQTAHAASLSGYHADMDVSYHAPPVASGAERPQPETLGQLGGQIAHDFNNVLAVVLTSVEVAMRVGDPAKAGVFLANAVEVIKRGRTLTDKLAAASQAADAPSQVDVHVLLEALAREIESESGSSLRVLSQFGAEQRVVTTDPAFLAEALGHLAANAREAMKDGGTLTLSTHNARGEDIRADAAYDYIVVGVEDTGSGMSEDVRLRAFDLFFTTKSAEPWRGLGLAQVRDVARRAGGTLAVESEAGQGTRVALAIPLSQEA